LATTPPQTVEIARKAQGKGLLILIITDNEVSPVARLGAHVLPDLAPMSCQTWRPCPARLGAQVLYVNEARLGHFRSQVPAMVVAQAIVVSLGRRLGQF
jgi:DNA-binding MurR/RpiR family transcriptional regulator